MINWAMRLPWNLITSEALTNNVDPKLVAAIVQVETNGNNWKTRYEPEFNYLLHPENFSRRLIISVETEKVHQRMSWGYMQVMGTVARELGFLYDLTELTRPGLGLKYGCKKLRKLAIRYNNVIEDMVAAYNAGSVRKNESGYVNQRYVTKVMRHYAEL